MPVASSERQAAVPDARRDELGRADWQSQRPEARRLFGERDGRSAVSEADRAIGKACAF